MNSDSQTRSGTWKLLLTSFYGFVTVSKRRRPKHGIPQTRKPVSALFDDLVQQPTAGLDHPLLLLNLLQPLSGHPVWSELEEKNGI